MGYSVVQYKSRVNRTLSNLANQHKFLGISPIIGPESKHSKPRPGGHSHPDPEVVGHVVAGEHGDVGAPLALLAKVLEPREEALARHEHLADGGPGVAGGVLVAQHPTQPVAPDSKMEMI